MKKRGSLAKKPDDDDCDLCETGFGQCDHLPRCRGRVSSEWLHFPGQQILENAEESSMTAQRKQNKAKGEIKPSYIKYVGRMKEKEKVSALRGTTTGLQRLDIELSRH